jgi:hypothetical protein
MQSPLPRRAFMGCLALCCKPTACPLSLPSRTTLALSLPLSHSVVPGPPLCPPRGDAMAATPSPRSAREEEAASPREGGHVAVGGGRGEEAVGALELCCTPREVRKSPRWPDLATVCRGGGRRAGGADVADAYCRNLHGRRRATESREPEMEGAAGKEEGARRDVLPLLHLRRTGPPEAGLYSPARKPRRELYRWRRSRAGAEELHGALCFFLKRCVFFEMVCWRSC